MATTASELPRRENMRERDPSGTLPPRDMRAGGECMPHGKEATMSDIDVRLHVRWLEPDGTTTDEGTVMVGVPLDTLLNMPYDVFGDAYDETRARVADKVRLDPRHLSKAALVQDMPDEDVIGYPLLVPAKRPRALTK